MSAAVHLKVLAAEPRPAGSEAAARARAYCADALRALGFEVRERPFSYSAVVGELGTPLGGLVALAVIAGSALASVGDRAGLAIAILVIGALLLVMGGRWLARRGVLVLPFLRREGINLEAWRSGTPGLWLVAHIDSKSQPVPLLLRAAGIMLLAVAYLAATIIAAMQRWSVGDSIPLGRWQAILIVASIGALPVLASVVGRRSAGAIDNATGVATVLDAARLLPAEVSVGVLITDAEELGLAGARAWCDGRPAGIALNCDGLDDAGILTLLRTSPRAPRLERAFDHAATAEGIRLRIIPLIPGVLVDGVALGDAGWETITMSHGTLSTLRIIHTRRDSADRLRGEGAAAGARVLARAARTLAGAM